MIFVTVGAQMPFDRLISAVDTWAETRERGDVFGQIGPTDRTPQHIEWTKFLDPPEFRRRVIDADAVVAHAGMGSILTALEHGKPILVMPRLGRLHETRNDHQVATAERFRELGCVAVAMDETELPEALDRLTTFKAGGRIDRWASPMLLDTLSQFIDGEPMKAQGQPIIAPAGRRRKETM